MEQKGDSGSRRIKNDSGRLSKAEIERMLGEAVQKPTGSSQIFSFSAIAVKKWAEKYLSATKVRTIVKILF